MQAQLPMTTPAQNLFCKSHRHRIKHISNTMNWRERSKLLRSCVMCVLYIPSWFSKNQPPHRRLWEYRAKVARWLAVGPSNQLTDPKRLVQEVVPQMWPTNAMVCLAICEIDVENEHSSYSSIGMMWMLIVMFIFTLFSFFAFDVDLCWYLNWRWCTVNVDNDVDGQPLAAHVLVKLRLIANASQRVDLPLRKWISVGVCFSQNCGLLQQNHLFIWKCEGLLSILGHVPQLLSTCKGHGKPWATNKGNQLLKRTKNTFQKYNLGTVEHHAAPIFEDLHDMSWIHDLFLVFDRIDLVFCLCPSGVTKLTSAESAQKILGLQSMIEENSLRNSKSRYVCKYVSMYVCM